MLVCLTSLTSCASAWSGAGEYFGEAVSRVKAEILTILAEKTEILEFFDEQREYIADFGVLETVEGASSDSEIYPVLKTTPHTEIIESLYNRGEDGLKIFNYGDSETVYAPHIATLTEYEKLGYTAVRNFAGMNYTKVIEMFTAAGVECEIEVRRNPAPAGDVFAINYAGVTDGDVYYINPSVKVRLYVSAEKEAVTETDTTKNNVVYITFDDGPSGKTTIKLLDILDTYGVKATFFTTGNSIIKSPDALVAISKRGHGIGCHTVSHNYDSIYESVEAMENELLEWERIVASAGVTTEDKLFRYPGGSVSKYMNDEKRAEMNEMLHSNGYRVFDWNVVTNDSVLYMREDGVSTYDFIRDTFRSTFASALRENDGKNGAPIIILMHEGVDETVDLLPWVLEYLIGEGYTFGSLSDFDSSWTFEDRKQ